MVAYARTAESNDTDIDRFYDDLDETYSQCKSTEVNIVLGNFNVKVGSKQRDKTVGPFGLGVKNERGERLIHWCEEKEIAIMDTWFDTHPRHRYTWISPGERTHNQIDCIYSAKGIAL